jgi:RimJ/RimL family protein N-acetyltransferase
MTDQPRLHTKLEPLTEADFDDIADLAAAIWRPYYSKMVSMGMIDYMLKARYTHENLRAYLNSSDRWFELLRVDDVLAGYCSYSLTPNSGEMKLEQLYLLESFRGKGLGRLMIRRVDTVARVKNLQSIILQVNKQNADSISIYRKAEFQVRESAIFDIGNGYFMDDYIMQKII